MHPDYYIRKEDFEKRAIQHSMYINDCFEILSDKRKRAIYLIETLQKQKLDENEITQNKKYSRRLFCNSRKFKIKSKQSGKSRYKKENKSKLQRF